MPSRILDRHFSRRMLPLAALAGLVLAAAPPLSYRIVAWQKLGAQARINALHIAAGVRIAAARQPYFWRYNAEKVIQATTAHRRRQDIGSVRITGCDGSTLFSPERLAVGTGRGGGPSGWSPITVGDRTVAWVEVIMDPRAERETLLRIAMASGALGLAVGLLLFLFPTGVVRRQAAQLGDAMQRLKSAETDLVEANKNLSDQVAAEVGEVRRLSERVVRIQEEERGRIARDLHDSVGQALTALQLKLESIRGRGGDARSDLDEVVRMCRETIVEIRRVVRDLRPPELGSATLDEILRSCVERFEERTGIAASFRFVGEPVSSEEIVICLLRVLQEALVNAGRHSEAHEVGVALTVTGEAAILEVIDDGKGFVPAEVRSGAGHRGIRERCAFLGGSVDLQSTPGGGTRLLVRLPLRGMNS